MGRRAKVGLLLQLCLVPFGSQAVAQSPVVQVRLVSEQGEAVAGALVRVLEGERQVVAGAANENGRATLTLPRPGIYVFSVERLGYASWHSSAMTVGEGLTAIELRVPVQAVELAAVMVEVHGRCSRSNGLIADGARGAARGLAVLFGLRSRDRPRAERQFLLARAIEHTFPALRAVVESRPPGASWDLHITENRPQLHGADEVVDRTDGRIQRVASPFPSPEPEWLAANGFIKPRDSVEDQAKYFAPTPEVILSESFLGSHCFSGEIHPDSGWLGLVFEPLPGVEQPDVKGVVWVDSLQRRPVRIEFHYSRLSEFLQEHERRWAVMEINRQGELARRSALIQIYGRDSFGRGNMPSLELGMPRPKPLPMPVDAPTSQFGGTLTFGPFGSGRWDVSHWEIRWPTMLGGANYTGDWHVASQYARYIYIVQYMKIIANSRVVEVVEINR
jgi:hypothetical protein